MGPVCFSEGDLSFAHVRHQMTPVPDRRRYPRFIAWLPIRLTEVAGKVEPAPVTLLTQNISRTGVCFPAPRRIEPGKLIKAEVTLAGVGPGGKDIYVSGAGRIVRVEAGVKIGWYKLAATFDETVSVDDIGWHKLAAAFDEPPSPATNS
jgi:hypothetical protein